MFFSLSRSKLPGYIVPVFPALGILDGVALDRMDARAWGRQLRAMMIEAICGLLASPIVATLNANHTPNVLPRLSHLGSRGLRGDPGGAHAAARR